MNPSSTDAAEKVALTLLTFVVTIVLAATLSFAVLSQRGEHAVQNLLASLPASLPRLPVPSVAALPQEPPVLAPAAILINEQAIARVDEDAVRLFFVTERADLPEQARSALAHIVAAAKAGTARVHISSFHEDVGDAAAHVELARRRAQAVHALLLSLGVARSSIVLDEPVLTSPELGNAQAQRVQVTLIGH